jgi:hypothetical protein|tara:strand:+ start:578 stop:790 length:213 start_codon:yes stop_codon:yes gene_type:complete
MELIILTDGVYQLVTVTEEMLANLKLFDDTVKYADLCDILRIKLSTYAEYPINAHVMNDGSGDFFGCIWK